MAAGFIQKRLHRGDGDQDPITDKTKQTRVFWGNGAQECCC